MTPELDLTITAPFAVGDLVARVHLASGASAPIVLRDGHFRGEVGGVPVRVVLTGEPPPEGDAPLAAASLDRPGAPGGTPVDVRDAFGEHGIPVPGDGRLAAELTWGAPCHDQVADPAPEGTRFLSWEHIMCARLVGQDATGAPLVADGMATWFSADTRLAVGPSALRFGEIVALAGDFYAHLDDKAAADFAWAWPEATGLVDWVAGDYRATTLAGDSAEGTRAILEVVFRDKDQPDTLGHEVSTVVSDGVFGQYPARRYLALASQNHCHFGSQPADGSVRDARNEALRLYRAYHHRALAEAGAAATALAGSAAFERALVTEAFGCHFLTDLFASGHIRVPRRALAERFGVLQGSLSMSAGMHGEDNERGLWCRRRGGAAGAARVVWRVYGDGALRKAESVLHLSQVLEAVRLSVAEVFAVYAAVATRRVSSTPEAVAAIPAEERAEAFIPVPLAAGATPGPSDVLPDGSPAPRGQPNSWPRYWLLGDGRLAERLGGPDENRYTVRDERGHVTETLEIHAHA
jgi:hypothetical protein